MKRVLSLVLVLVLVGTILPTGVFTNVAKADTTQKVYVNGVDLVAEQGNSVTCGSGSAFYDRTTRTLTLNNAQITSHSGDRNDRAGIAISGFADDEDITIKLIGDNSIYLDDKTEDGIYKAHNVGIMKKGFSKLSIVDGGSNDAKLDINIYNNNVPLGIQSQGSLYVGKVELGFELQSGSSTSSWCTSKMISIDYVSKTVEHSIELDGTKLHTNAPYIDGIRTIRDDAIIIKNGADIEIETFGCPIYTENGDLTISDSEVYASTADPSGEYFYGMCSWANINMTDSNVTVNAPYGNGIYCFGKVKISGGKTDITSKNDDGFRSWTGITIDSGAQVTATGYGCGIYTNGNLEIMSGTVKAKALHTSWCGPILTRLLSTNAMTEKPLKSANGIVLGLGVTVLEDVEIDNSGWFYGEFWSDAVYDYIYQWGAESYYDGGTEINIVTVPYYATPTETEEPTATAEPTEAPTVTVAPTEEPTVTVAPTEEPTVTAAPTEEPTETAAPTEKPSATPAGGSISKEEWNKNSKALNTNISVNQKNMAVEWGEVSNASGYDIYVAPCNKKISSKYLVKTVSGQNHIGKVTETAGKKISGKKNYKVRVKAFSLINGRKVYIGKSMTCHVAGSKNKKYTNAKKVEPAKKEIVLKKNAGKVLEAKIVKQNKKLLSAKHGPKLSFFSSDEKVATVTAKGKIVAKKKGKCTIYVVALNGVKAEVKVTVK